MTELSVVIPSWNTRELLRACLASVREAEKPDTEVIVVDNGSADGSADMVERDFPEVVLVRNAENRGFAGGCNQGIALAKGELVLLLNSDTEVRGRALARLCEFLRASPEYGAAAAKLVNPDGSVQRASKRFPGLATALWYGTPLERWFPENSEVRRYFMRDWDHASDRDVEQPPGACLMLTRAALDRVGGFDEELWLFYNDVDLSRRLAAAGFRTRLVADAEVMHHEGASTRNFTRFVPVWNENRLAYYRKHHGRLGGLWVKACVALVFADWSARQLARRVAGRDGERVLPMLRVFLGFLAR